MPGRPPVPPKYRHYKPKDLAVVRINGKDHYLGKYNSPESHERYGGLLAEWAASGRVEPPSTRTATPAGVPGDLTVSEPVSAYMKHAEMYYRSPSGKPTNELANMKDALRPVRRLYAGPGVRTTSPDISSADGI